MEFCETVMEKSWNFVAKISWQPCMFHLIQWALLEYEYTDHTWALGSQVPSWSQYTCSQLSPVILRLGQVHFAAVAFHTPPLQHSLEENPTSSQNVPVYPQKQFTQALLSLDHVPPLSQCILWQNVPVMRRVGQIHRLCFSCQTAGNRGIGKS